MKELWKHLSREDRIAAIIRVWVEGSSSTDIAEGLLQTFEGPITRNSIIGLYHRVAYGAKGRREANPLERYPLLTPHQNQTSVSLRAKMESKAKQRKPRQTKVASLPPQPQRQEALEEANARPPAMDVDLVEVAPDDAAYDASGLMLTVLQLSDRTCRWSVAYVGHHLFCGHPAVLKSSYCEHHKKRAASKVRTP